jgi:SAM-dependent methyltransferase
MDTLNRAQLETVPWNTRHVSGPDVPPEPAVEEMSRLARVPFLKRDRTYALWYSWVEIVRALGTPPKRVLDASCGRGIVSQVLHLKGFEVVACDVEDCFTADKAIEFRRVDLNGRMPYPSRSFDAVVNCEGLEYLESSFPFLREAARVLVPGGKLHLSVPNIQGLAGRYHFFRTGKLAAYDDAANERINVICLLLLKSACERCGFSFTRIRGNVPLLTRKIKAFDALFGKRLFKDGDEVLRHAHSLVIECSLNTVIPPPERDTPRLSPPSRDHRPNPARRPKNACRSEGL